MMTHIVRAMNECKLNVKILSEMKISVEGQIALVNVLKERLSEILPEGTKVLISREFSNEELMEALR